MLFMPINYVFYQQGDEDIVFDEETTSIDDPTVRFVNHYLAPVIPNPARDEAIIHYVLEHPDHISLRVLDQQGNVVKDLATHEWKGAGSHFVNVNLSEWNSGAYFVQLMGTNFTQAQKLMVVK
jgi:hypothetical protein